MAALLTTLGGDAPWWRDPKYAANVNGQTVFPTWLFDGAGQRYAKSSSPTGAVSQVAFTSLLEVFTRASTATYFDASGTLQTAAINQPRFTYNPATLQPLGLLVEEARTNLLLNSETLSTQNVTTSATTYTLSFYGTGTVTLSGTSASVTVGTALNQLTYVVFLASAGTLTVTVSGTVKYANLEAGSGPTSWIPTTGTTVTRAQDGCYTTDMSWFNINEGMFIVKSFIGGGAHLGFGNNNEINRGQIIGTTSENGVFAVDNANNFGSAISSTGFVYGTAKTTAMTYGSNYVASFANGVKLAQYTSTWTTWNPSIISPGRRYGIATAIYGNQPVSLIMYYPKRLTDAEIQRLTGAL